eukprot:CAMPEP_0184656368 /NCGR_PEP_ID=MMETSP0308-20130426/16448_1 /TAXON_ID=38269 /ORGANISM="Gloeochaete witrockiana, Strain SAG 46.84" /LENGTH=858 /DNA_ID=CAMNT_0027093467 /DNA_START=74 /DNA_END=2650 /DNA_ORIENTATION=+
MNGTASSSASARIQMAVSEAESTRRALYQITPPFRQSTEPLLNGVAADNTGVCITRSSSKTTAYHRSSRQPILLRPTTAPSFLPLTSRSHFRTFDGLRPFSSSREFLGLRRVCRINGSPLMSAGSHIDHNQPFRQVFYRPVSPDQRRISRSSLECVAIPSILSNNSPLSSLCTIASSSPVGFGVLASSLVLSRALISRSKQKLVRLGSSQSFGILARIKFGFQHFCEQHNLKKVVPMLLMFFTILFGYTVLRDTKDVLVITAPGSGAEAIPFLKTWAVLPAAFVMMGIYNKASDQMSREKLFYASVIPFMVFFALFALVLYPMQGVLHPHAAAEVVRKILPAGFGGVIAIFENWTYSLFYIMAEMWGSVLLSLGFWTFANDITGVDEARKLYPILGLIGNVPALLVAGGVVKYFSKMRGNLPPGVDQWGMSLKCLMSLIVLSGAVIMGIYRWMTVNVVSKMAVHQPEVIENASDHSAPVQQVPSELAQKDKKPKTGMAFMDSIRVLSKSKILRNMSILVVCYGVSIQLVEVMWKAKCKLAFPNPNEYSAFMGEVSMLTGMTTCVSMIMSKFMLGRFGWGISAMTTPVTMLITGLAFVSLVLFPMQTAGLAMAVGSNPLLLTCILGSWQNALAKAAKYALFDPCKEMVFIPLDKESKSKGKAAVDVMGALLGKSGGSVIQQICLFTFGSLAASMPCVSLIFLASVALWIWAVHDLEKDVRPLFRKTNSTEESTTSPSPTIAPVISAPQPSSPSLTSVSRRQKQPLMPRPRISASPFPEEALLPLVAYFTNFGIGFRRGYLAALSTPQLQQQTTVSPLLNPIGPEEKVVVPAAISAEQLAEILDKLRDRKFVGSTVGEVS